jgi:hypothetical protein
MKHIKHIVSASVVIAVSMVSMGHAHARQDVHCNFTWEENTALNVKHGVIYGKMRVRNNEYNRLVAMGKVAASIVADQGDHCLLHHPENILITTRITKADQRLNPSGRLPNCSNMNAMVECRGSPFSDDAPSAAAEQSSQSSEQSDGTSGGGSGTEAEQPSQSTGQTQGSPNIVINNFSLSPSTPVKGEPVEVRVGVYNNGTARAGSYKVEWYPGENYPQPACSWNVSGNNVNGGKVLNCTYDGYPSRYGSIRTKVVADSGGQVEESNEGDNTRFMQVRVLEGQANAEAEQPADDGMPAEAEQPAEGDQPATASYRLLPSIRLPGNDLRLIEMSSPNWMLCRQACTDDESCRAFTYRAPNANSGPICLLKSGVGMQIPGTCCQSGVKQ